MDAVSLPPAIALPNAFGAPGTPLPPGQVIQALVLELVESDVFRLQLPHAVVDVRSDVALTPGSTIALAVKGGATNARLTIFAEDPAVAGSRRPIGEAVIIARDAPSISPARAPLPPSGSLPVIAATPERALGEAVRVAATRQSGLAPLIANVEQAVHDGMLPAPVRAAAAQVLSLRVPLDETLTAADVKQAFVRSGVLFEPRLAARAAGETAVSQAAPAPADDLKAALLVFRQVVKVWADLAEPAQAAPTTSVPTAVALTDSKTIKQLAAVLGSATEELLPPGSPLTADQATSLAKTVATAMLARGASPVQPEPTAPHNGPPLPYRGAALAAQAPELATISPDSAPHDVAERLLAQTDGAIARQTLLQAASLPDRPDANMPRTDPNQRWTFEIPFATPQGTGVAQFEVSRDGRSAEQEAKAPVWRARFSLELEPMGPVHAVISIAGERASVTLWAERMSTATRLTEHAPMLNEALRAAELDPSDFSVRVGAPPAMRQAAPGRFMDRAS